MKRKLLSLVLAATMLLGCFPIPAMATLTDVAEKAEDKMASLEEDVCKDASSYDAELQSEKKTTPVDVIALGVTYDLATNTATVEDVPADAIISLGGYLEGKMVFVKMAEEHNGTVSWELPDVAFDTLRVFGLNENYSPICEASVIDVNSLKFEYEALDNDTCMITGYTGTDANVVVPDVLDGMTVTKIADHAFSERTEIETIILPDTICSVGLGAFYSCTGLRSITIPDSVEEIGIAAFEECSNLVSITLPDGVLCIDNATFEGCRNLLHVDIPKSVEKIGYYAFYNCEKLTTVYLSERIWFINDQAFDLCSNVTAIVVENSYAHTWCKDNNVAYELDTTVPSTPPSEETISDFTYEIVDESYAVITGYVGTDINVTIPSKAEGYDVCEIGMNAFRNKAIESVVLPETLLVLQQYAFYGCQSLTNIELPDNLRSVGYGAFYECTSLESITIPEGLESIGSYAFLNTSIAGISLPEGLLEIGQCAFEGCTKLSEISIPDTITVINKLFVNCTSLSKVELPESLTTISYMAFYNCSSLEELIIPETVTDMNLGAFGGCTNLVLRVVEGSYVHNKCEIQEFPYKLYEYYVMSPEEETSMDYLVWSEYSTHVEITGYIGEPTEISIPKCIDFVPVRYIGEAAFADCTSLTSATLPDGVIEIKDSAFAGCNNLEDVALPDSVTSIGYNALSNCSSLVTVSLPSGISEVNYEMFRGCSNLTSMIIPEGVTSIGTRAFMDCTSLASVMLPESLVSINYEVFWGCSSLNSVMIPENTTQIGSSAFHGCSSLTSIAIPCGTTSIAAATFSGCSRLSSVTLPETVTSIGNGAFADCSSLERIALPASVANVGSSAFCNCTSLESIVIPEGVVEIGQDTFYCCSSLVEVTIPNSVTAIGFRAFALCTSIENITLPSGVTSVGNSAFSGCSSLASVVLNGPTEIGDSEFFWCTSLGYISFSDGTTTIGNSAFYNCDNLKSVVLPNSIINIGKEAFALCDNLSNVTLPVSVDSFGAGVFSYCTSLTGITLPEGITAIQDKDFYDCRSLKSITIPEGVTSIGKYAFYQCYALKYVALPDSVISIADYAFYNCGLTDIVFPASIETVGESAFIHCNDMNVYIPTLKDWLEIEFGDDSSNPVGNLYVDRELITHAVIPDGVTYISDYAFFGYDALKSVTIPDSVKAIGTCTFNDCDGLTSMELPDSLEIIGNGSFSNCDNLVSVDMSDSVETIGSSAFYGCIKLSNISFPDSLILIGDEAFKYCDGLTSIDLPEGLKSIGNKAFYSCVSLRTIIIPGSETRIGENAFAEGIRYKRIHGKPGSFAEVYADETECLFFDITAVSLDMSAAKLDKTVVQPGDRVTISGIRVKNADYVHFSGNNLHLKEEDSSEAAFDVPVDNSEEWQTLDNITMVLSAENAVEGAFYISVQAFDGDEKPSYIDQSTLAYIVSFTISDFPVLDMTNAELDKSTYAPGDIVTISGIRVKNADYVHFSGNNLHLMEEDSGAAAFDVPVDNSEEWQTLDSITMVLSAENAVEGAFYISVQAADNDGNESDLDKNTLAYTVFYKNIDCTHAPTGEGIYLKTVFQSNDNSSHIAVADVYQYTCANCNLIFEETIVRSLDKQESLPHAWENGVCQSLGCKYTCDHAEYTTSWVDGKSKTISIVDNKDGTTHTHTYTVEATCDNCQMDLGMRNETNPSEEHRIKNKTAYYKVEGEKHQKVTPRSCSCGYEVDSTYGTWENHVLSTTSVDTTFIYLNKFAHDAYEDLKSFCVCGTWLTTVSSKDYVENHIDKDENDFCDKCLQSCDLKLMNEYHDILRNTKDEANPLSNTRLSEILNSELIAAGFTPERSAALVQVIRDAPDLYRDLFLYSFFEYGIQTQIGDKCEYNRSTNILYVSLLFAQEGTFFHETGHAIDCIGTTDVSVSISDEYLDLYFILEEDIINIINVYIDEALYEGGMLLGESDRLDIIYTMLSGNGGYYILDDNNKKWVLVEPQQLDQSEEQILKRTCELITATLLSEIDTYGASDYRNSHMFADMMSAYVGASMFTNTLVAELGHSSDYWRTDNGTPNFVHNVEAWAEFFSAQINKNEKALEMNYLYFPNACNKMEAMAKEMLKQFKERVNNE